MVLKCDATTDNTVRREWLQATLNSIGITPQTRYQTVYTILKDPPKLVERQVLDAFLKMPTYTITRHE